MSTIETRYGLILQVSDPDLSRLGVKDVYASLSKLCRFNGHCSKFYSVADHSVNCMLVAKELGYDRETIRLCLCHDFSEIIVGDIPTPAKRMLPDFLALESQIEARFMERFGLSGDHQKMKLVDRAMARYEARYLMAHGELFFPKDDEPLTFAQDPALYYGIARDGICEQTFLDYCDDWGVF